MSGDREGYIEGTDSVYWAGPDSTASGILPFATRTSRICLAWRSPSVHQGSCWGTIGGACKSGMSPEDSAIRELTEETGYNGQIKLLLAYVYKDKLFRYYNYLGFVDDEFTLTADATPWETTAIGWFPFDRILVTMNKRPELFHPGLRALFSNAGPLITRSIFP